MVTVGWGFGGNWFGGGFGGCFRHGGNLGIFARIDSLGGWESGRTAHPNSSSRASEARPGTHNHRRALLSGLERHPAGQQKAGVMVPAQGRDDKLPNPPPAIPARPSSARSRTPPTVRNTRSLA